MVRLEETFLVSVRKQTMTVLAHSWYRRPMDARSFLFAISRTLSIGLMTSLGAVFALGCEQEAASASTAKVASALKDATASRPGESAPSNVAGSEATIGGKSEFQEQSFRLTLKAPKAVVAGKLNRFIITLQALEGFKVNAEYPLKFRFAEVAGVEPSKKIVRKEDAKLAEKQADLPLDVMIKEAGKYQIAGKFSFSVCTEERCLIEKRDLLLEVQAI